MRILDRIRRLVNKSPREILKGDLCFYNTHGMKYKVFFVRYEYGLEKKFAWVFALGIRQQILVSSKCLTPIPTWT